MSLIGIASGHREHLSIIVSRYVKLLDGGKGPIMSICGCENLLTTFEFLGELNYAACQKRVFVFPIGK